MSPFSTRKLRLRDGKCLAQGHIASQWWVWDWTPSLDPEVHDMVFQIWHDFPQRMGFRLCPRGLAPCQPLTSCGPPLLAAGQGRADKASAECPPHAWAPTLAPQAVFSVIAHSFQLL